MPGQETYENDCSTGRDFSSAGRAHEQARLASPTEALEGDQPRIRIQRSRNLRSNHTPQAASVPQLVQILH